MLGTLPFWGSVAVLRDRPFFFRGQGEVAARLGTPRGTMVRRHAVPGTAAVSLLLAVVRYFIGP